MFVCYSLFLFRISVFNFFLFLLLFRFLFYFFQLFRLIETNKHICAYWIVDRNWVTHSLCDMSWMLSRHWQKRQSEMINQSKNQRLFVICVYVHLFFYACQFLLCFHRFKICKCCRANFLVIHKTVSCCCFCFVFFWKDVIDSHTQTLFIPKKKKRTQQTNKYDNSLFIFIFHLHIIRLMFNWTFDCNFSSRMIFGNIFSLFFLHFISVFCRVHLLLQLFTMYFLLLRFKTITTHTAKITVKYYPWVRFIFRFGSVTFFFFFEMYAWNIHIGTSVVLQNEIRRVIALRCWIKSQ